MKLLYFSWIKQQIGVAQEDVVLPDDIHNMKDLITWLIGRGPEYERALCDLTVVRFAINQEFAGLEAGVVNEDEIAIFPPITGGKG